MTTKSPVDQRYKERTERVHPAAEISIKLISLFAALRNSICQSQLQKWSDASIDFAQVPHACPQCLQCRDWPHAHFIGSEVLSNFVTLYIFVTAWFEWTTVHRIVWPGLQWGQAHSVPSLEESLCPKPIKLNCLPNWCLSIGVHFVNQTSNLSRVAWVWSQPVNDPWLTAFWQPWLIFMKTREPLDIAFRRNRCPLITPDELFIASCCETMQCLIYTSFHCRAAANCWHQLLAGEAYLCRWWWGRGLTLLPPLPPSLLAQFTLFLLTTLLCKQVVREMRGSRGCVNSDVFAVPPAASKVASSGQAIIRSGTPSFGLFTSCCAIWHSDNYVCRQLLYCSIWWWWNKTRYLIHLALLSLSPRAPHSFAVGVFCQTIGRSTYQVLNVSARLWHSAARCHFAFVFIYFIDWAVLWAQMSKHFALGFCWRIKFRYISYPAPIHHWPQDGALVPNFCPNIGFQNCHTNGVLWRLHPHCVQYLSALMRSFPCRAMTYFCA